MAKAARDFGGQDRPAFLESIPKPIEKYDEDDVPWMKVAATSMPPMMLDLCQNNGRVLSRPYSSMDFVDYRDAGHLQIGFLGLTPTLVTIEGRNLEDLRGLISSGRIRRISETDERDVDRNENQPAIDRITIETFSRP